GTNCRPIVDGLDLTKAQDPPLFRKAGLCRNQIADYGLAGPTIGVKTNGGGSGNAGAGPSAGGPSSGKSLASPKSLKSFSSVLRARSLAAFAATRFSRFSFPNAAISAT